MDNSQVFRSLRKCEVCDDKCAKYTCPRCELKTCCIACINIHKKELECDGIRNKVFYKPLSQFTNLDLLSDYRLLEETNRCVERLMNDPSKQYTGQQRLPINLFRLRDAARSRGTKLEFLPHNFSRSKENTTFYNWNERLISWRIEWIFPQANNLKCVGTRSLETELLSKLANIYLDSKQCEDKLQYYHSAGLAGVLLLLKGEKKFGSRYHELDTSLTLKENLKGKTIIEFPTIYVIMKDHKHTFDIVSPDEEEMEDVAQEENENKNNLLFKSDFSDSEEEGEENEEKPLSRKRKYRKLDIPNYDKLIKQST